MSSNTRSLYSWLPRIAASEALRRPGNNVRPKSGFDRFTARLFGYTVPDEPVQAIQAQPSPFGVDIVIVVGGVQQEIPVIKYADTAGGIDRIHSD